MESDSKRHRRHLAEDLFGESLDEGGGAVAAASSVMQDATKEVGISTSVGKENKDIESLKEMHQAQFKHMAWMQ